MRRVEIESTARVFDDFFVIEEARLRYEKFDGQLSRLVRRLNFDRGDSVAALIYNARRRRLVLINQFRYPTYAGGPGWITETVAGIISKDEDPETAIRREILEETGYKVDTLEHISTFYVSPGGSSERVTLYYAEVCDEEKIQPGGGDPGEDEDILTVELTIEEAERQMRTGGIADAKTIIGIMWLVNRMHRENTVTKAEGR